MKTQKQNEPQLSADEEKIYQEFIKLFDLPTMTCEIDESQKRVVASLGVGIYRQALATALEEQRAEILNEVESLLVDYFSTKAFSSTNPEVSINLKYVQNTIQKELRAKLAQMKGKE